MKKKGYAEVIQVQGNEIQHYLLDAAKVLGRFCEEHHLTYYLSGGTLLGAVRHKGFIPWDDDIDIMMPRKDYEILIKEFTNNRYSIECCETNPNYGAPYARLLDNKTTRVWKNTRQIDIGIYVDILPIDGYPNSLLLSNLRNRYLLYLRHWREFMISIQSREGMFKGFKEFIRKIHPFSANYYSKKINRIGKKYDFETMSYVGVQSGTYHQEKERNPRSVFDHAVYLKFEDTVFPAPSGYDEYLRNLFGDYMKLPPENQRVGRHDQLIYLKEDE